MTTEVQTTQTESKETTPQAKDPGELTFSEYEAYRRSGEMPKSEAESTESLSALAAEKPAEQKESTASGTEETATEDEKDESKDKAETEDEAESEEEAKAEEGTKKKGGFQRKIDKLTSRVYSAQQEIEYWKEQALKGAGQAKKETEEPKKTASEGKPDPNDYDTHEAYLDARDEWNRKEWRKEQDKARLEAERTSIQSEHAKRVQAFAAKHDDFEEMLTNLDDVPNSPALEQIIVSSENGPELLYELAKNPKEAKRIALLPPLAAAKELGKLESAIASRAEETKKPETKKTTQAPPPVTPVGKGTAKVAKSLDDPTLSYTEYERMRRDQMKRKRA